MNIRFVGEQDGPIERELKQQLVPLFNTLAEIRAAYLANADYQDGSAPSVVLCLHSDRGADAELVGTIGKVFTPMFSVDNHLDVLFVNESQETELKKVCVPFYTTQTE